MTFQERQVLCGFEVVSARESRELHGRTILMEHRKTGAKLFWLDNGEENMVFSVGFRTLPEDSTGVFHILEHSVLGGSGKFPVREPFVELMKSSMNTFLNAMTFPDMTLYPVASRNPRDLLNLAEVYLDGVFDPEVIRDEKRFLQEGWHIDRNEAGQPEYRGVVFNEMKGSMSDTDTLIDHQIAAQLFPDTCYGFNSGGDPAVIPDLTWEKFRETYRRFYHPSNAFFYLDGAVPAEELLCLIDSYLKAFDRREEVPQFRFQTPVASEQTIFYEIAQDQEEKNASHLTLARIVGTWRERARNNAIGIIGDVLTGSNEAPLKRAALEKGLAQDLSLTIDDTSLQSWVTIHADNVTDGKEEELMALCRETGERIRREGLDRRAAEASLNRVIFHMREEDEPQGIGRCIRCMSDWIYGGDPRQILETEELVRELKRMLAEGEFDRLAADVLLNREGLAVLHSRPSKTIGEEKRRAEEDRLRRVTGAWTAAEWAENERQLEALNRWQSEPDAPEALSTLPTLKKEDADVMPEWTPTEEGETLGVRTLVHEIPSNDVVHLRAFFALTDLSLGDITAAGLLTTMLGRLSTKRHDALSLQQEIKRYTGSVSFSLISRSDPDRDDACTPYLTATVSALRENADRAMALVAEILTETRLDETDRIQEMIQQSELAVRQRIVGAGHLIAVRQVLSQFSADGAVRNALDGPPAAAYIHRFAREPETVMPSFLAVGKRLLEEGLCRKRMTVSWTADDQKDLTPFISAFPEGEAVPAEAAYAAEEASRMGYRIPAQVGFFARGYRLSRCGASFSGSLWLAASILSLGYLWNRVRVQGGAYGAGIQVDRRGNLFTYSYRDPSPDKTMGVDAGASAFLREFAGQEGELDKFIISSLNDLNPLLSPRDRGLAADLRTLSGYTREMSEKTRKEILNATPEDLLACCRILDAMAAEGAECIVAPGEILSRSGLTDIREL